MFIVFLRFSEQQRRARELMDGHRQWIDRGFEEGVFLMVGSLKPNGGGVVWAHNTTLAELRRRVSADPFVAEGIVDSEIVEIAPSRVAARLKLADV